MGLGRGGVGFFPSGPVIAFPWGGGVWRGGGGVEKAGKIKEFLEFSHKKVTNILQRKAFEHLLFHITIIH